MAELYDGMLDASNRLEAEQGLQMFLDEIEEILPLNDPICRIFASERRRLRLSGNRIEDFDLLIGSTALHYGLTLLTNNRRHFQRMRGLSIISA